MARSTTIRLEARGLREFARAMGTIGDKAFDRSQRKAVTFIAKDYARFKTGRIATDIDRPRPFTKRAYDWDGSPRTGDIFSRAFVRPKQAKYLDIVETGGTRRHDGSTGPVGILPRVADRFGGLFGQGGIKRRFFDRQSRPTATSPSGGSRYRIGAKRYAILDLRTSRGRLYGVFEKKKRSKGRVPNSRGRLVSAGSYWQTSLIVRFVDKATYKPKLNFRRDAGVYARQRFPALSLRLFNDELNRARSGR